MKSNLLFTLVFGTLTSGAVLAEEQPQSRWGLGLGAIIQDQGYTDIGNESQVVPVLYYESENLEILGPNINYNLYSEGPFDFKLNAQYRFDGFKDDDGDIFIGMEERSGTIDLGFSVDYESDYGDFSFQYMADAGGEHKGNEISLSYQKPFFFERSILTPYFSATRMSEDLVDYYYGVRSNEVTANRGFYQGEATTNIDVGVRYDHRFDKHHSILADFAYTAYGSGIKDSPLVDSSGGMRLIVGYVYVF